MSIDYHMDTDFFGMPGVVMGADCGHRVGFTHLESKLIKDNLDDSALARVHELECGTCGHVWRAIMKSLPARN